MIINKVREIREDRDISQQKLAKLVGISRQSLYSIEQGKSIPGIDIVLKLAHVLNVKVERLFVLKDFNTPRPSEGLGLLGPL